MLKFFLSLFLTTSLFAQPGSGNFAAAEDAYRQGDFEAAIRIYLKAIESGEENASVFYNLGTSLYKNGELGAALAAHLRARRLAPMDPDIRYNLRFLQEKARDKLDTRLTKDRWQNLSAGQWLSERALFWWTLVPLVLALILVAFHLFSGRAPWLSWSLATLLLVFSFYPGLSLGVSLWQTPDWGAVVSGEVEVLASPTVKNAVAIFHLHEGAPFAVIGESGDWFKIQLSDGKTGWVQREHLAIFGKKFFSYQTAKSDSSSKKPAL